MGSERVEELLLANRELARFTHRVGHDLRAPLRTLEAFTRIIEGELSGRGSTGLEPRLRDALRFVMEAGASLSEMVDDLVLHATVLVEEPAHEPVDTAALLAALCRRRKRDAGPDTLQLEGDAPPRLAGSEFQLGRLFALLVDEGIRRVGRSALARITVRRSADRCEFRVCCAPAGVEAPEVASASPSDPCHREDFESPPELRWELCERIVRVHGGTLGAVDAGADGVRFELALPLTE